MSMAPIRLYADAMPDPPVEQAPDLTSEESPVVAKARNFVVVPIPLSNPTLGTGLVLGGAYFYKQTPEQKASQPASLTGAAGMYTSNDSFAYGIGQQSYWGGDKWRFSGVLGHADIKLDLTAPDPGGGGVDVDWDVRGDFLQAKLMRRIVGDWYFGVWGRYFDNTQEFSANIDGEEFGTDVNLKTIGLGVNIEYDTRDVPSNAYTGSRFEIDALFNDESLGSSDTYQSYDARYRSYHQLKERLVFAWEVRGCYKSGDIPLWDACKINLRGFAVTEYLSKQSASAQAEARWRPFTRFGFVAFLGGGINDRNFGDFRDDDVVPSYGVGARWMVMKAQRINMRIDYARSDNQDAWYLAVNEAF